MSIRRAVLAASTTIVAALAIASTAQPASARVVQTIGATGSDPLRIVSNVALGPGGSVYAVDHADRGDDPLLLRVYSPAGILVRKWRLGIRTADEVAALRVDGAGDVYVASSVADTVLKFSPAGQVLLRLGPFTGAPAGQFAGPVGLGVDPSGNLVVQDARAARIETFSPDGRLLQSWAYDGDPRRAAVSVGASGIVYVVDRQGIAKLDPAGNGLGRIPAPRQLPAFAPLTEGPAGTLYAMTGDRILDIGAEGAYRGAVGNGAFSAAVAADGSIYVPGRSPSGRNGAVLRLAPITEVDETRPTLSVDRFALVRQGRSPRVPGRLRYTLSEAASLRIDLLRRAKTTNRRNRRFGEFLFLGRSSVPAAAAGSRVLELDWRRLGAGPHLPPGLFRVTIVARDDSGNESPPAQVTFRVRR